MVTLSDSDYLQDIIKQDHEETDRLLLEGLESGEAVPLDMAGLQNKARSILK